MPNPLIDALRTALQAALRRPTLLALGLLASYFMLAVMIPASELLFLVAAIASVYAAYRAAANNPGEAGMILLHVGTLLLALGAATLLELEPNGTLGVLGCAGVLAAPCLHARHLATSDAVRAAWTTLLVVTAVMTVITLLVVSALNSPSSLFS